MLLLPIRAVISRRSNRHLHHRRAAAFATTIGRQYAGEQAMSASVTSTRALSLRRDSAPGRVRTLARPHPGACVKGGIRTRFSLGAKYPKSSPPASVEPRRTRQTGLQNSSAALSTRRQLRTLERRSALPSVSGSSPRSLRQAPRTWARASQARAPGSGSPVPASCRDVRMVRAAGNKKPSGAVGSGGSVRSGLSISLSSKIAPKMTHICWA